MSSSGAKRPQFFEGQYLGAGHLDDLVTYHREQAARHSLAGHTWGIAMGLQLEERETPAGGGEVDVYIQPGYAWDGFGRPIVVLAPFRLPHDKFENIATGQVKVWLRYKQSTTGAPPPGFETCETAEQYARVQESFDVEVGEFSHSEQHDEFSIAGESVDAMNSLHHLDDSAPLYCDESIPFQMFPEDADKPRWLIPLGYVNWVQGTHGQAGKFEKTEDEEDKRRSRKARIYIGAVTENLYAADGLIRLCDRGTLALSSEALSTACDQETLVDEDLLFDEEAEVLSVEDLVWVEGNLRAKGDVKLFGKKLDFRDDAGSDGPLWIRRTEDNDLNGKDLQVVIGDEDEDVNNRFAVGSNTDTDGNTLITHFNVLGSGNVGIGLDAPEKLLHIQGSEDPTILVQTESRGEFSGRLSFRQSAGDGADIYYDDTQDIKGLVFDTVLSGENTPPLIVKDSGMVGIGTTSPEHDLQIGNTESAVSLSLRGPDNNPHSTVLAFEETDRVNSRGFQIVHDSLDHKLSIVSERYSIITFTQPDGWVGIGTEEPTTPLQVDGGSIAGIAGGGYLTIGKINSANLVFDTNEIQARIGIVAEDLHLQREGGGLLIHSHTGHESHQFVVTDIGEVGVGTSYPTQKLDVRGNIVLGHEGELFAVGGVQNMRMVAGSISVEGEIIIDDETGDPGFSVTSHVDDTGEYTIDFSSEFSSTPVIVTSPLNSFNINVSVDDASSSGFVVRTNELDGANAGRADSAFSFIAIGIR